jgi:hypothetical protein
LISIMDYHAITKIFIKLWYYIDYNQGLSYKNKYIQWLWYYIDFNHGLSYNNKYFQY